MAWATGMVLAALTLAPAALAGCRPPVQPALAIAILPDSRAPGSVAVAGQAGSLPATFAGYAAIPTVAGPALSGGGELRATRLDLGHRHSPGLAAMAGTWDTSRWPRLDFPLEFPVLFRIRGLPRVFYLASLLALALVLLAVAPRPLQRVAGTIQAEPALCALWGLATFALVIPAIVLSAITIIGIPITMGLLLGLAIARLMAYAGLCLFVGGRLVDRGSTTINPAWHLMVGAVAIAVVTGIPLVGQLVSVGLSLVDTGAVVMSRFGRKAPYPTPPLPGDPGAPGGAATPDQDGGG